MESTDATTTSAAAATYGIQHDTTTHDTTTYDATIGPSRDFGQSEAPLRQRPQIENNIWNPQMQQQLIL